MAIASRCCLILPHLNTPDMVVLTPPASKSPTSHRHFCAIAINEPVPPKYRPTRGRAGGYTETKPLPVNGAAMVPIIIGIVVVLAVCFIIASIYNNLVTSRNRIDNAWQNIDTQLQRRCDLIGNLVETVKGYAAHESETLQAVVSARNATASASTPDEKMAANNQLTGALRQLFALAESYPDLKSNANFAQLQTTLEDTENKVSYARQSYNDCVLKYNNAIQTFPGVIFAGIFQFKPRTGFAAADEVREVPKVQF